MPVLQMHCGKSVWLCPHAARTADRWTAVELPVRTSRRDRQPGEVRCCFDDSPQSQVRQRNM